MAWLLDHDHDHLRNTVWVPVRDWLLGLSEANRREIGQKAPEGG